MIFNKLKMPYITDFIYKDPIIEATFEKFELKMFNNSFRSAILINWLGSFYFINPNDIPTTIKKFNIANFTYDILDKNGNIYTEIGFGTQEELFKDLKRACFLKSFQDLNGSELVLNFIKVKLHNKVLEIRRDIDTLLYATEDNDNPTCFNIRIIDDLVKDRLEGCGYKDLRIRRYNIVIFAVWLDSTLINNTKSARNH